MNVIQTNWFQTILIFVIVILFAYLIGFSIVNLVDEKIGNVEIKIPKIHVPNIQVTFDKEGGSLVCKANYPSDEKYSSEHSYAATIEKFDDSANVPKPRVADYEETPIQLSFPDKPISSPEELKRADDMALPVDEQFKLLDRMFSRIGTEQMMPHEFHNLARKRRRELATPMQVGCTTDSDCNIVWGDGKNTCKSDRSCHCVNGSGPFCQYGPTNYKDPKDMTDMEMKQFRYKYRNDMTLQDYKNWLMTYKDDDQHLRSHHRENLAILMRGGQLTEKDIPAIRIKPPMDPADYFKKMYEGGKISVHFPDESETGAMLPANYGKYDEFLPPEKLPKSWITGIVDLYKRPLKDDAKAVNFYLRPEVTVGVERELVGEEYLNWVKRHHNLADIRKIQIRRDESINTFQDNDQNVETV